MADEIQIDARTLPVLPLTSGVVLPQMVVTLALETGEARAAADAALSGDRRVLLVPRTERGYARVGTLAQIEDAGDLPSGLRALVVRGVQRAVIGAETAKGGGSGKRGRTCGSGQRAGKWPCEGAAGSGGRMGVKSK